MPKKQTNTCGIAQKENWETCASSKICKIKTKDAEQASNIIPFAFAEQGRKQTRYHQLFKYVVLSIIIKNQPLAICIVNEHQSSKILKF